MDEKQARELMMDCFKAAVRAVHPENCLEPFLPAPPPDGKIILLAGGKAAGAMMKVAIDHYLPLMKKECLLGVAVGKSDGFVPMQHMEWIEAGHPVPDEGSVRGAKRVLQLAHEAGENDLVVVLLSGGASALWCAPVEGVSLGEKQQVTRQLLRSGAKIDEINTVRKQLSAIKNGKLTTAVSPARLVTLAISDVVGDHASVIASGPTFGDGKTLDAARRILDYYRIEPVGGIAKMLPVTALETRDRPRRQMNVIHDGGRGDPDDDERAPRFQMVADSFSMLSRASDFLGQAGYYVEYLGEEIEGEVREVAVRHARLILEIKAQKLSRYDRIAILSGGELTVSVKGRGRGGPNQEYALALAMELDKSLGGLEGVYALCADTDGCDGGTGKPSDPAGAMIFPSTLQRAHAQKLNPATFLADNNSGTFFDALGDLLFTGSTGTNVNDFRLILLENA